MKMKKIDEEINKTKESEMLKEKERARKKKEQ
jgi:hypothetical protein